MPMLHKIYIRDIMIKTVITVDINDSFSRVWEIFRTHKIRHLPVVNQEHKVKGLITQRDLYRTVAPKRELEEEGMFYLKEELDKFILSKVMIQDVKTLLPEDTLGMAIALMVDKKFGCLPVIDHHGILVGMLTQTDALKAIAQYFL